MKTKTLLQHYKEARAPYFSRSYPGRAFYRDAASCLRMARQEVEVDKTRAEWRAEGGDYLDAVKPSRAEDALRRHDGDVAVLVFPDESARFEDLCGDTYNPAVNTDIPRARLEREKKEFAEKVDRDGVWGVEGYFRHPGTGEWESVDSCWGFVGDDFRGSGHDVDIIRATLAALAEAREEVRDVEAFVAEMATA